MPAEPIRAESQVSLTNGVSLLILQEFGLSLLSGIGIDDLPESATQSGDLARIELLAPADQLSLSGGRCLLTEVGREVTHHLHHHEGVRPGDVAAGQRLPRRIERPGQSLGQSHVPLGLPRRHLEAAAHPCRGRCCRSPIRRSPPICLPDEAQRHLVQPSLPPMRIGQQRLEPLVRQRPRRPLTNPTENSVQP
jgi:hypothetical protein